MSLEPKGFAANGLRDDLREENSVERAILMRECLVLVRLAEVP